MDSSNSFTVSSWCVVAYGSKRCTLCVWSICSVVADINTGDPMVTCWQFAITLLRSTSCWNVYCWWIWSPHIQAPNNLSFSYRIEYEEKLFCGCTASSNFTIFRNLLISKALGCKWLAQPRNITLGVVTKILMKLIFINFSSLPTIWKFIDS